MRFAKRNTQLDIHRLDSSGSALRLQEAALVAEAEEAKARLGDLRERGQGATLAEAVAALVESEVADGE